MSPELSLFLHLVEREPSRITQTQWIIYYKILGSPVFSSSDKEALSIQIIPPDIYRAAQHRYYLISLFPLEHQHCATLWLAGRLFQRILGDYHAGRSIS